MIWRPVLVAILIRVMIANTTLSAWENYYVIVGSSAAALTGLQFVVMALVSGTQRRTGTTEVSTYSTPTIIHFTAALLIAAILSAPWPALWQPAIGLGLSGLLGIGLVADVTRRARKATLYKAVLEDWIWHSILPFIAYLALAIAAATLSRNTEGALFTVAGCALLLVFIGIHNAWDTAMYVAIVMTQPPGQGEGTSASASANASTSMPSTSRVEQPASLSATQSSKSDK